MISGANRGNASKTFSAKPGWRGQHDSFTTIASLNSENGHHWPQGGVGDNDTKAGLEKGIWVGGLLRNDAPDEIPHVRRLLFGVIQEIISPAPRPRPDTHLPL